MNRRFRVYVKGNCVGVSIYADHFVQTKDQIWFFADQAAEQFIAIVSSDEIEAIKTGPSCDDVVWPVDQPA